MQKTREQIAESALDLVGRTPMVRLNRVVPGGAAEVVIKLEGYNPAGSVKDRPAKNMLLKALERGEIQEGATIVEPTSGNTGIGLAMAAAVLGLRCIIVLPAGSSQERVSLLKAYGAEVELSPEEEGMPGAIRRAEEIVAERKDAFLPQQFKNPDNPDAHRHTTALEILEQTGGRLDAFVATAGTGGTISGTGQVLREHLPNLHVAVVEPASSPVISGGKPGRHKIPGMGPGFVPDTLDRSVFHEILQVTDEEAREMARRLPREEGLLVGPSSGAAVVAAIRLAERFGAGKRIVTMAPDNGERYLSTDLYG